MARYSTTACLMQSSLAACWTTSFRRRSRRFQSRRLQPGYFGWCSPPCWLTLFLLYMNHLPFAPLLLTAPYAARPPISERVTTRFSRHGPTDAQIGIEYTFDQQTFFPCFAADPAALDVVASQESTVISASWSVKHASLWKHYRPQWADRQEYSSPVTPLDWSALFWAHAFAAKPGQRLHSDSRRRRAWSPCSISSSRQPRWLLAFNLRRPASAHHRKSDVVRTRQQPTAVFRQLEGGWGAGRRR